MTDAERRLWSRLRDRRLRDLKFVRQLPIGPFIADFACRDHDLVIEVDGGQHANSARDLDRTKILNEHGFHVLRFWNNDVLSNLDGVLQVIVEYLERPSPALRFAPTDVPLERRGTRETRQP